MAFLSHALSEQAMQRGLIGRRAGSQRLAVVFHLMVEAPKPVCPLVAQMPLNSDPIDHGSPR